MAKFWHHTEFKVYCSSAQQIIPSKYNIPKNNVKVVGKLFQILFEFGSLIYEI